ncbi:SLBB domain-containing protein [Geobacter sp. DSM 9736]|uniref:SLBB domain-containing protein n=1 Tax=Geobacter sp. DSM 9736 TaxID=1277350 RepID=UPI000B503CDE|nr:SLBB domain-containing protein [Geobacter sp. DSM 9736]SNB47973.1 protein involved in polysaccharide export, contains SLBB domain of the beta-grasp fold [Geobacter sp. DSM 9736]
MKQKCLWYFLVSLVLLATFSIPVRGQEAPLPFGGPAQQPEASQHRPDRLPSSIQQPASPQMKPAAVQAPGAEEKPAAEDHRKSPSAAPDALKQFGYDLFDKAPSSFAPGQHVPVGPDYVIGPGDAIKIEIWGKIEGSWNVVVDNDGNISLPKAGVFGVTGLTFRELKEVLHKKFSKYYTGFEMNVSMGSLRSMRIYLVGKAERPGAYTVSSLSTIINGLLEGGGPSRTGSMRNIQVKRNGQTVVTFDLYDFLLNGDKTRDIRLMPEDVIFIPPIGPLVGIAGNVKTPAIYELKGETRLLDLIRMAGGLTGNAFKGRVQMQRVQDRQFRTLFEGDLIDIETSREKNFLLQDGDMARIFPVVDAPHTINVSGAVAYPGEYAVNPETTRVQDVIALAGGLRYFASKQAELARVTVTQDGPRTDLLVIDLDRAAKGEKESNLLLQRDDTLFVRPIPEWSGNRTVTIGGEVRFPGTYTLKKGERLSSVLERAGGFTERAHVRGAVFTREKVRELQQKQIDEMVERLERDLISAGTAQAATASSPDEARMVQIEMEQKRHFVNQLKSARAKGRIALNMREPALIRGTSHDIELEQGDAIFIPADPNTVQVIGSVFNQSAFVHDPAEGYRHYIDLAGGYAPNADEDNVYILQADGTAVKACGSFFRPGNGVGSGDTIVVPEKIERVAWMRNVKDITQILFQIAVATGVVIALF